MVVVVVVVGRKETIFAAPLVEEVCTISCDFTLFKTTSNLNFDDHFAERGLPKVASKAAIAYFASVIDFSLSRR